jgi:hypothetical protein
MRFTSYSTSITISNYDKIPLEFQSLFCPNNQDSWTPLPIEEDIIVSNLESDESYVFREVDAPHIRYVVSTTPYSIHQLLF